MRTAQLRYFLTILELGSFRLAAQQLHVSQPALSESMKNLERELGAQLMERDRSGVRLTAAGEEVLPYLRIIVEAEEALKVDVDGLKALHRGKVRIGATCVAAMSLLPPVISSFNSRYPSVRIQVTEADSASIMQTLKSGIIDIGLTMESARSAPAHDEAFSYQPLLTTRLMACVPKDHSLAGRAELSAQDLIDEPFILLGNGSINEPVQELVNLAELNVVVFADSVAFARRMVASGVGITTLPELSLEPGVHGADGDVVCIPLTGGQAGLRLTLVRRRRAHPSRAVREFWADIVDHVANRSTRQIVERPARDHLPGTPPDRERLEPLQSSRAEASQPR
jgi:DNA-binding transcriptional LysR family regulator